MDLPALKTLIKKGENAQVEFKKKANHPEKIIREVIAFANTTGGHLFIGVADDRSISGLKYPEEDEFILSKAISELCKPKVDFETEIVKFENGNKILHYQIKEGNNKPHYAFLEKKHRYGKAFIRVNDQSIQASLEMRKILKERESHNEPIPIEESTQTLFKYFENNPSITLKKYCELSGLNKGLASKKLVSLALSGALKVEPREGADLFKPVQ